MRSCSSGPAIAFTRRSAASLHLPTQLSLEDRNPQLLEPAFGKKFQRHIARLVPAQPSICFDGEARCPQPSGDLTPT
jgi:hypothetical protein